MSDTYRSHVYPPPPTLITPHPHPHPNHPAPHPHPQATLTRILIQISLKCVANVRLTLNSIRGPFMLETNFAFMQHSYHVQATGLDAWASRVKCPARFVSHLHEICIYIYIYELFIAFVFLLFVHYCNLMLCVVYWVGKWRSRGSTGMFGNLMAIYHIMLQFIQNHYKSTFS